MHPIGEVAPELHGFAQEGGGDSSGATWCLGVADRCVVGSISCGQVAWRQLFGGLGGVGSLALLGGGERVVWLGRDGAVRLGSLETAALLRWEVPPPATAPRWETWGA